MNTYEELENCQNQLQSLVDALDRSAIISIADKDGKIIKINDTFCRISKYAEQELLGKDHKIVNSGYHPKEFWKQMWRDISRGKTWRAEVKNKAKDGSFYWVDTVINPMFDKNRRITSYLSIRYLITDRKEQEFEIQTQHEELQATEEELRQNLEELNATQEQLEESFLLNQAQLEAIGTSFGYVEFDLDKKIIKINPIFAEWTEFAENELIGLSHKDLLPQDEQTESYFSNLWKQLKEGKTVSGIFQRRTKSNKNLWIFGAYCPIKNEKGEVIRVVKIASNYNSQKESEIEIQAQQEELQATEEELRQNLEELNATQEQMAQSTQQVLAITEALDRSAIISIADKQGKITKINEEFCRVSQYTEKELLGQDHKIVNSGYHSKEFWKEMWRDISRGKMWRAEVKNKAKDGSYYWVDTVINPMLDNEGKISSYLSIRSLITDRKEKEFEIQAQQEALQATEEELRQNLEELNATQEELGSQKEKLEQIFDGVPAMIYQFKMTPQGVMSFPVVSKGSELVYGLPAQRLIEDSSSIIATIHPDDIPHFQSSIAESAKTMTEWKADLRTIIDGKTLWIRGSSKPTKDSEDNTLWSGIVQEITAQKLLELDIQTKNEELQATEEELRQNLEELSTTQEDLQNQKLKIEQEGMYRKAILENAPMMLIATDLNGIIISFNSLAEQLLGYEEHKVVGKVSPAIFHDMNEVKAYAKQLSEELGEEIPLGFDVFTAKAKRNLPTTKEWTYISKDGNAFPVELQISTIKNDKTGEIMGYLGMAQDITERKEAQKELQKLSVVARETSNAIVITDAEGYTTWVNEGFTRTTGYTLEEIIGKKPGRLLQGKETNFDHVLKIREALKSKQPFTQEILNYDKMGKKYWLELNITPVLDEHTGEITQFIGIETDVTQRKRDEEDLKRLSVVASQTSNAVVMTDAQGFIIWVNEGFLKLTEYSLTEVIGKKPGALLQGKGTNPNHIEAIREGLKSQKPFVQEILNYTKYGRPFWLELNTTPIFDEKTGELIQFVGIENDITIRREAEELVLEKNKALQTSEEELRQNFEELQTTQEELQLQKIEVERTLKELKNTQSQLIHSEKMATLGQLVANIAHEINTPLGAIRSSAGGIEQMFTETLPLLPEFLCSLNKEELQLFNDAIQTSAESHNSLSTKEKRNLKYAWIEKLKSYTHIQDLNRFADLLVDNAIYKDEKLVHGILKSTNAFALLQMISHILSVIRSNQTIQIATERASKIIFALKNFSHQDHSGIKETTDINQSIENTLMLYQNQLRQGIEIHKELHQLPHIMGFPDELVQVWTNLVHNAIQAMNNKGILSLKTSRKDKSILISIADTGAGIPKEVQERIFDPFFTTKKAGEGSGLGLDIARKIIEKHNGKIWFDSKAEKGTTFFVEIPV